MFWGDYDSSASLRRNVSTCFESWSSEGKSGGKGYNSGASSEVSGAVDFSAFAGIITRVRCPVGDSGAAAVFVGRLVFGIGLDSPSVGHGFGGIGSILPCSASGNSGQVLVGGGGGCNSGEGEDFEAHFFKKFN